METEKKQTRDDLYRQQMAMLDTLLSHHAITREQYDQSAGGLTAKMYPDGGAPSTEPLVPD